MRPTSDYPQSSAEKRLAGPVPHAGMQAGMQAGMHAGSDTPLALSAQQADAHSRRAALAATAVSFAVFLALAPFASVRLGVVPLFVPAFQAALIVSSIITATLLLIQLRVTRERHVLVLACAYFYTSLMALVHLLSYPGAFGPSGVIGGGAQTTGYLFVFWHTGFPLLVAAYAYLKRRPGAKARVVKRDVVVAACSLLCVVVTLTLVAVIGNDALPPMLTANQYTSTFNVGRYGQWVVTALAAVYLAWARPHSVLDRWLLVALCAWFIEIGLVGIFNNGRYDLGFYAGRIYALLAATFVLAVLLWEQGRMYFGLAEARETALSEAELRNNREVLRLAMAGGRMGAWTADLRSRKVWWSAELHEVMGLPTGSFAGTREAALAHIHADDQSALRQAIEKSIAERGEFAATFRARHVDGSWLWIDARGRAAFDEVSGEASLFGIAMDVTARRRGEEAELQMEARFQALADGMAQLAWMARPDGWIYWYNRRWYDYTGTTPADMEGWGWQAVHDPQQLPSVLENWQRSIATGERFEMVFPLRRADGQFRSFLTQASPLKDAEGRVIHWFGTNTDITLQLESEEALRAADRRKDEFIATLAHELRNPLAPIRSAVEVMGMLGPLPPKIESARAVVDRQSRHLARLVDDLLEMSRITQGKVQLRRESISIQQALQDAMEATRPLFDKAGQQIQLVLCDDPLHAHADATRIAQVFVNLLSNASKFTPAGGQITVTAQRDAHQAIVEVCDCGIGIEPANLESIFQMFSQVTPALDRTQSGLGIGLALVRGLVALHGGSIRAASGGLGQGACFEVRLPLHESARPAVDATPVALPDCLQVLRVLVVDDNKDAADTVRALLEMTGHTVRVANSGAAALQLVNEFWPDVVLLDIGMPGMNGYEVARALRAHHENKPLVLVALTGWGQEQDRAHARDAGFNFHLTKPFDPAMLNTILASVAAQDRPLATPPLPGTDDSTAAAPAQAK